MKKITMLILLFVLGINAYAQNTSKQDSSVIKAEKEKLIRSIRQAVALFINPDFIQTVRTETKDPVGISSYVEGISNSILNKNGIASMKEGEDLINKYREDADVKPFFEILEKVVELITKDFYSLQIEQIQNSTKGFTEAKFDSEVELNKAMQRYVTKIRKLEFYSDYNYDVLDNRKVDINTDGIEDYIVVFSMTNRWGSNFQQITLAVFLGNGSHYNAVADYSTTNLEIMSIKGEIISFKKMEYQGSDPHCCPSLEIHQSIRLRNNIFIDESNGMDLSEFSSAVRREEEDTDIPSDMEYGGEQKVFYNDSDVQEIEAMAYTDDNNINNDVLSSEFEEMKTNIANIYKNQSNRVELYVQFGEAKILRRVNTMENIEECECSYSVIRNNENNIIYISETPYSYSGDTHQNTDLFFDDNGELKAVDYHYSAFEGIIAPEAARLNIQCMFNNRQRIHYKETLTDFDGKPLPNTKSHEEQISNELIWNVSYFLRKFRFTR